MSRSVPAIYRPPKRLVWMLRWHEGGRLYRKSTGTRDEGEATEVMEAKARELAQSVRPYTVILQEGGCPVLRHIEARSIEDAGKVHAQTYLVLAGHHGNLFRGAVSAGSTLALAALSDRYGDSYVKTTDAALRASRECSWARSRSCVVGACEFFQEEGVKDVHEVTRTMLVRFREVLRDRVADATVNKYHRTCSAAWTWAVDAGYAHGNPWLTLSKLKVPDRDPVVLSAQEWKRVIRGSEGHQLHGVICTALYAGLRNSEICRLRWKDVDFEAGIIRVACDKDRLTKGRSGRSVPLSPALAAVLRPLSVRGLSGLVFRPEPLREWTTETISRAVSEVSRMVSVAFGLQVLRRTFASICTQDLGVSKNRVQEWLGHASIRTTESYYVERRTGTGQEAGLLDFGGVHGSALLPP